MQSFVCLSDIHYPYEDPLAMRLVNRFLEDFRPDVLVFNGDIWDMPQISKYDRRREELKDPKNLQEHLDHGKDGVAHSIEAAHPKETLLILGNHEDRWENYLGSRAPELASLRSLGFESVFNLGALKWKRYGEGFWLNDSLFVYHGSYTGGSWTDRERVSAGASTITGHMHQQRVTYHRDRARTYKNVAQGCLCLLNPPYLRTPPNWQQGFVYGYLFNDGKFRIIETEIVHGEDAIWMAPEGQLYSEQTSQRKTTTPSTTREALTSRLSPFRQDLERLA